MLLRKIIAALSWNFQERRQCTCEWSVVVLNDRAGVSRRYRGALKGKKFGKYLNCSATERNVMKCGVILLSFSGRVNLRIALPFRPHFHAIESFLLTRHIRVFLNPRGVYNRQKKEKPECTNIGHNLRSIISFSFTNKKIFSLRIFEIVTSWFNQVWQA